MSDQSTFPMSPSERASEPQRPFRLVWRNLTLRGITFLGLVMVLIGLFALQEASRLGDSNGVTVAVLVAVVLAQTAVIKWAWPRWPWREDLPLDASLTGLQRFATTRVVPGSAAVLSAWGAAGALVGIVGVARILVAVDSPGGRVAAGIFLGACLLVAVLVPWVRGADRAYLGERTPIIEALQRVGFLAVLAAAAFAFATKELHQAGLVELTNPQAEPIASLDPDNLVWFYGWHLIDALPGSPLSTLKIDPPYDYDQTRVGAMLLAYTLLVVAPLLQLLKQTISRRKSAATV